LALQTAQRCTLRVSDTSDASEGAEVPSLRCSGCAGSKTQLLQMFRNRTIIQFAEFYPVGACQGEA
jgi:hypothetical protein